MSEFVDKHSKILIMLLYIAIAVVCIYFFFTKILWWILPFLFAYLISLCAEPLVMILKRYLRFPRKLASILAVLLVIGIIGGLITLIIIKIIYEIENLTANLPVLTEMAIYQITNLQNKWHTFYMNLPPNIITYTDTAIVGLIKAFTDNLSTWGNSAIKAVGTMATSVPNIVLFIMAMFLSSYFFTSDRERIRKFIHEYVPKKYSDSFTRIKVIMTGTLGNYIKAQSILLLITFFELSVGFAIIGIEYSLILSISIALIDALPIFGTGTILIPWSVISFISGDFRLGISLLLLYGIIWLVRQLAEPRIVSSKIGLHPILTLLTVYIGLNTLGFLGMILFPILTIIIINFFKIYVKKQPQNKVKKTI